MLLKQLMFFVTFACDTLQTNHNPFGKDYPYSLLVAKHKLHLNCKNKSLLKGNLGNFLENTLYRSFYCSI